MAALIKHPKDFYAGLLYAAVGTGAIVIARDYTLGTSVRMGPGYFPTLLGTLLLLTGAASMLRAFCRRGEAIAPFFWKELLLVLGSVVVFGLVVRDAGLLPALALLVVSSAWASHRFNPLSALLLAALTSGLSALIFVKGLGLPFAIVGPWFGG